MKTAFTIIVPMYNVGREIHRCLSSLRTQTYPEFEVLLLDDGSTDDTVSICRETAARDSRFRLIENPHHGTASPLRNLGIRLASKEYIVFLDGDDEILADSLECFSSAVERYGAPDVLGAGVCSGRGEIVKSDLPDSPSVICSLPCSALPGTPGASIGCLIHADGGPDHRPHGFHSPAKI